MKTARTRLTFPVAAAALTAAVAVAGCSAGSASSGSSGTGLMSALARVTDTANTRSQILYDNTAALVRLSGSSPAATGGYASLRGLGVPAITDAASQVPASAGFDLFGESYGISAGNPPQTVALLAGGQDPARITSRLTSLGWKRSGSRLVGPTLATVSQAAAPLAEEMPQVQPDGSSAVYGGSAASLSQIGSPHGATLAGDASISALASCLGNVVAAEIFSGGYLGGARPAAVAIGVSQPASSTATPQTVVCVSWPGQAAAGRYTAEVRQALASGTSLTRDTRYATFLTHPAVTGVGGSGNLVRWQASTPGSALAAFQLAESIDLPALPDCPKLPAAAAARVIGCS